MVKKIALLLLGALMIVSISSCQKEDTQNISSQQSNEVSQQTDTTDINHAYNNTSNNETDMQQQTTQQPIEEPSKEPFDVTKAYVNKPYTDKFAIERVDELQYIDDYSLYFLSSSEPSPIFYESFYRERGQFNVNLEHYDYDLDNETIRKYFDTYEYSKLASAGAVRLIDSFVYKDNDTNRMLYYCYYTITHWSEDEKKDTMDYYRDLAIVSIKDKSISLQERIPIRTALEIPKEISGEHDFHNVI